MSSRTTDLPTSLTRTDRTSPRTDTKDATAQ